MRGVFPVLAALLLQGLVSAETPPFQNGTEATETTSLAAQITDGTSTTAVSQDDVSASEPTASAALRGSGGGGGNEQWCSTTTIVETCTVTETICGKHCPGKGQTT